MQISRFQAISYSNWTVNGVIGSLVGPKRIQKGLKWHKPQQFSNLDRLRTISFSASGLCIAMASQLLYVHAASIGACLSLSRTFPVCKSCSVLSLCACASNHTRVSVCVCDRIYVFFFLATSLDFCWLFKATSHSCFFSLCCPAVKRRRGRKEDVPPLSGQDKGQEPCLTRQELQQDVVSQAWQGEWTISTFQGKRIVLLVTSLSANRPSFCTGLYI